MAAALIGCIGIVLAIGIVLVVSHFWSWKPS